MPIFFEYFRHRDPAPASEAILITEGGPGSSITQDPFLPGYYRNAVFAPLLAKRDLILLDQRGVGRSGAIDCKQVQHGSTHIYRDVRACGSQLGFAAPLYSTGEVALDIEEVRKALAIEKLDFYGGSYAAQDIQAYAVRFPGHLRSAVLDSPSTSLGFSDFDPTTAHAVRRTVRLVCARSRSCAGERNAVPSVAWLAHRLRRQPLDGVGHDENGQPRHVHLTEGYLIWRLLLSDAGAYVSVGEIGAAADALRAGDEVPLLRLGAEEAGLTFGDEGEPPTVFSAGHNWARYCTDNPMPWDKNASIPTRLQQWRAARAALSPKPFSPFSIDGWLAPIGALGPDPCIDWPAPRRPVAPPVPRGAKFPATVPALILNGDLDLSTASPNARRVAQAWPNSRFVEVANSGHRTTLDGRRDCSQPIVVHFIAKLEPGNTRCASQTQFTTPGVGRFALNAADARPAQPGREYSTALDLKIATVAAAAVTDAFRRTFLQNDLSAGVGLRGGTFRPMFNSSGTGAIAKLKGVRFARDVAVSGTSVYNFEPESIDATITVDGPGREDGKLHVSGAWFALRHRATVLEVKGELAGRRIAARVPAS